MHNRYGCLPSKYDARDYKMPKSGAASLPVAYMCRQLPNVKNQGSVSSCVAHATSSILEYHDINVGNNKLSTNFIYGIQKKLFGREEGGMYLRDACKIVLDYGDPLAEDCSGNNEVPKSHGIAEAAYEDQTVMEKAKTFRIKSYFTCKSDNEIKQAIMNYGPVLVSIKWFDDYKVDKDGALQSSQKGDYGYHAVMVYGWNAGGWLCQNSWGKSWGTNGRFLFPYKYGFVEARGMIDMVNEDTDIIKPNSEGFMSVIYKIINFIANIFKGFMK